MRHQIALLSIATCLSQASLTLAERPLSRPTENVRLSGPKPAITSAPTAVDGRGKRQQSAESDTCGYISGDPDDPLTCNRGNCGFISVPGDSTTNAACCFDGFCGYSTMCIEDEDSSEQDQGLILICSGTSSACITHTWPGISAVAYNCDTSRTIITVSESPSSADATTTGAEPTDTGSDSDSDDDDGDDPGLGQEHDLSTSQRIGASVGSGVMAAFMIGFFMIFGCWLQLPYQTEAPRPRESPQPSYGYYGGPSPGSVYPLMAENNNFEYVGAGRHVTGPSSSASGALYTEIRQ